MIWFLLYNILSPFLWAGALVLLVFSARGRHWLGDLADRRVLSQRLGLSGANPEASCWIHLASLGEARSLANLLSIFSSQASGGNIHITCMTKTALDFVSEVYIPKGWAQSVSYAPFDLWPAVALFARKMRRARMLMIVETELWPNMIIEAKSRGIAVCLINARIGDKTRRWLKIFSSLAKRLFKSFDAICVSDESTLNFLKDLTGGGIPVTLTGNIKWDSAAADAMRHSRPKSDLRSRLGLGREEFFWVAASTREGEEEILFKVFKEARLRHKGLRLGLIPRHVERSLEVLKMAQAYGLRSVFLSRMTQGLTHEVPIVVVDRFGAALEFYEAADGVFVGGTLVPKIGGHNFLEPAALGKAVVIGPYFKSYKEVGEEFVGRQALLAASGGQELAQILDNWIKNPAPRLEMGARAQRLFSQFGGATEKTWQALRSVTVRARSD